MSDITTLMMAAAGNAAPAGYQIERSLRFNAADTAYLAGTNTTNTSTFTLSLWLKRSVISSVNYEYIFSYGTNGLALNLSGQMYVYQASSAGSQTTTAVFRDLSAWYHIVLSVSSGAFTLYVNNVNHKTGTIDQIQTTSNNMNLGRWINTGSTPTYYFNGYMAEVHFVGNQALLPSDFAEVNVDTGVWSPKAYTGTYGTNGFYLNFSDNSGVTAATLGADSSGNGNNWTPNNFSVTAGAGNDSLVDTPTPYGTDTGAGGEVRGNYATLNPLYYSTQATITNGNLDLQTTSGGRGTAFSTMAVSSGKFYAEFYIASGSGYSRIGVMRTDVAYAETNVFTGYDGGVGYVDTLGGIYDDTGAIATGIGTATTGDTIGVALNMDDGELSIYKNGSLLSTVSPHTLSEGGSFYFAVSDSSTAAASSYNVNFGQRPFAYTAPSGFKALCTQNLPDPTVVQGDDYFNTVLYTGNGSTQSITGVGFQPDFVWLKERSSTSGHRLNDAVRGVGYTLISDSDASDSTAANRITSFDSDGFSVGNATAFNENAVTYVAWNWNAGGSNATNTDGTITSTVRANPTAGFSIVLYTGTGSAATIGHGLGATPAMIIVKNRDAADPWQVYHQANTAAPETDYLVLSSTAATTDSNTRWNDTAPTSTVFSVGTSVNTNTNTEEYIAYVFADIEGFSKFGSYTGNSSADGTFVYTGFRPAFVLFKISSGSDSWYILDAERSASNVVKARIFPNLSNAEDSTYTICDFVSNGFKFRSSDASWNSSSGTYIYMAFAENPFKYSLAR